MSVNWFKGKLNRSISLFLSIVLFFSVLGGVVFSVSRKIMTEMSDSAIQNLSESLNLMQGTLEAILLKEAEFQRLMAQELALMEDPGEFIRAYNRNQTMVKLSLILEGDKEGITNTGEVFTEYGLDFSAGATVDGLPVSESYLNYLGTWAYCMKCPVERDGQRIAWLYVEYIYDSFEKSLPDGFYNGKAMLYIMDAYTQRFVLKPKGAGERDAGHLNLEDFYHANSIEEKTIRAKVAESVAQGGNILFYHNIRGTNSLNYMWAVNGGSVYLVGYVPLEAIQQEGRTVNQNIYIVVFVMLAAFLLCCLLYFSEQRQQNKIRQEREAEREIHNQQLAEALHAAQLANTSKTMFLSNMSHDIRTPMNAVLGFTTLLAKDAENPEKVREYTKKITASGQHLLSLINDILDVSKIESGKVVLSVEEFTLNDLVSSVDAIIRPMAQARGQNFYVEVSGVSHEYLMGDETRINQILINLLSNAVKYTQEGGSIWFRIIGLKQRSNQFEHIRIEVEDNGYGMTPEYLKIIFDAFTRAENSTTNKVQGTGLGMAITKNIVELMGGTIDVTSEVGKGSLFRVELECRIPEGRKVLKFWQERGISRILIVGKDGKSCENIRLLLEETGVPVDMAAEREAAAHLLESEEYSVVLMECEPETDVAKEAAALRNALPQNVPLMLLTAYGQEIPEDAHRLENTDIMVKPFFVSALQEKLAEFWEEEKGTESLPGAEENGLEGLHFLAAEDNQINAEILSEILSMEGASCEVVENGKLAVERFERSAEGEFDAILMDVQMPVMNGHDATRAIRALHRRDAAEIPIIAMTANAFAEDEKEALAAGMDIHMAKPVDVELLKKVIKDMVQKRRMV